MKGVLAFVVCFGVCVNALSQVAARETGPKVEPGTTATTENKSSGPSNTVIAASIASLSGAFAAIISRQRKIKAEAIKAKNNAT